MKTNTLIAHLLAMYHFITTDNMPFIILLVYCLYFTGSKRKRRRKHDSIISSSGILELPIDIWELIR